jgi:competence protein ComEA
LDINTASEAEIEDLPGIGPVVAQRIIAARPFKSADDLRNVKGIGDKKYEKLRPYFNESDAKIEKARPGGFEPPTF